jgi:hypothetical protein
LICCPWAYGSSLKQLDPHYLGHILGFWVTCGVKMMSLCQDWGWQKTQTSSCIQIRHTKCLRTIICCPWAYGSSLKHLYPHYLGHFWGFCVTCGVKMMSLHHDWGWQPTQTASCIHIRQIQSIWAHSYTVHGHMAVASNSYIHTTWVILGGSASLVESKWCHYIMIEADSLLKLLSASTLDIFKVFEHIDMLSMGIQQLPQTVIPTLLGSYVGVLGHLWSQNDVITSWLRLTASSNCCPHPS